MIKALLGRAAATPVAVALSLSACAHAQAGSSEGVVAPTVTSQPTPFSSAAPSFVASVSPFPVADRDGSRIAQPFLGGLDVPRPQLVDIDADGDLDLFIQERSGEVSFFEREGANWIWRTDRFHDLDVGEWYRFVDLDEDGDYDLMGELRNSYVRAWRNDGSAVSPKFTAISDTLRDADGAALFADRQNILNLADIDCNGRLDLFIGRVTGTVYRYEAEPGLATNGLARFRFVTDRWEGIEIVGPIPGAANMPGTPGGSLHGANAMAFGDVDGDGDLDLFWGDFFEQGILLIPNTDNCPFFSLSSTPQPFPVDDPVLTTGYNAPAPGDIDGDGDLDLVLGVIGGAFNPAHSSAANLYLLEQVAPGDFEVVTPKLIAMLDVGTEAVPALGDFDGDGDLDMLVSNKIDPEDHNTSLVTLFENQGSPTTPSFIDRGPLDLIPEFHSSPAITDLDGDGKVDLVLGTWRDRVQWWTNSGTVTAPSWQLADSALVVITRGSNSVPTLGDLDGDGDLDMVIGESSGALNLYRNIGSATDPKFELVSDKFMDIDVGRRSSPTLADLNGDGLLDLMVGSEEGDVRLWLATDTNFGFSEVTDFQLDSDADSAPAVGDLDGDGIPDLMVGAVGGGIRYFQGQPGGN